LADEQPGGDWWDCELADTGGVLSKPVSKVDDDGEDDAANSGSPEKKKDRHRKDEAVWGWQN